MSGINIVKNRTHSRKFRIKIDCIKIILLFLVIINIKIVFANVIINEIMYDPSGSDESHEWIEIYNNGVSSVNLSGWKLYEDGTNHGLTLINGSFIINADGYAIIADEYNTFLADYPDFNSTLLDSSWSSLSNTGEYLAVKNSSLSIIDFINYSSELANGNGRSLERFSYGWNESGVIGGSPGKPNNYSLSNTTTNTTNQTSNQTSIKGLKLTVYISEPVYVSTAYTSLFKIENLDHMSGITDNINLSVGYNITKDSVLIKNETVYITGLNSYKSADTGSFTPLTIGNYVLTGRIINSSVNDTNKDDDIDSKTINVTDTSHLPCNISINISADKEIYNESEQVKFYNNLNNEDFPFIIEYWIEDFFGNFYKNKYNTTNTNQKTWTTDISEEDRVLFIKAIVYPNCNDSNLTDNSAEKMFIVKATSQNSQSSGESSGSSLEIKDFDEKAKFGDVVNIDVNIYKGDTSKYSITLYAEKNDEKISEITKIHLDDKYSSFEGQLPLQIKPNCDLKFENGKYDVIIDGLGEEDKKSIEIEGITTSLCKGSYTQTSIEETSSKKFEYNLIDYPEKINSNDEFDVKIELANNDDQGSEIEVWSYVYRGSKCYSGNRTDNIKHLTLEKDSSKTITLTNKVENLEAGDYKLKIMINKDGQKTNKEITEDIGVGSSAENNIKVSCPDYKSENKPLNLAEYNIFNQLLCTDLIHYKQTLYESKNEQIKKMIPLFIIAALTLLSLILIIKRETF